MKIEIGEYVRTNRGEFYKIEDGTEFHENEVDVGLAIMPEIYGIWVDKEHLFYIEKKDIVAHSKNIIDLIGVGDYVNGCQVMGVYVPRDTWEPIQINVDSQTIKYFIKEEIKSIVTKEQFERIKYEV